MIHVREGLAFHLEPLHQRLVAEIGVQQLDGHLVFETLVVTLGAIHVAHSAGADQFDQLVVADPLLEPGRSSCRDGVLCRAMDDITEILVDGFGSQQA